MKRDLNLTEEQEQRRRDGLRLLARVIVRHWLEHPERYESTAYADGYEANVNYPNGAGGETARKEAAQ